ncbi:hypothetical protein KUTeg_007315 [Tegillarca granosa]|uniref:Cystatin domain-containing protein n=1 Tax=Tegillarca granosa TaxID=220873 RepID=A0ABQ9FHK3_TEGGR|nr:hypothetical protein KUTeg_007315 [Tegillarca granosa]
MMCGGTGDVKPKDNETQAIIDQVKSSFEEKNGTVTKFELVSYKSQVVAGTNYFAKYHKNIPQFKSECEE